METTHAMKHDPVELFFDGLIKLLALFEAKNLAPTLRARRCAKEQELADAIARDKRGVIGNI